MTAGAGDEGEALICQHWEQGLDDRLEHWGCIELVLPAVLVRALHGLPLLNPSFSPPYLCGPPQRVLLE